MSKDTKSTYDDNIVKMFVYATMLWGTAAFLFGVIAALQMAIWQFNFDLEWLTFGRLRPLHTNAAIFAFAGNTIFAGIYYSTQRLTRIRMWSDTLSKIHFWGWQLIIVAAAITLPLGFSQGKEYAELEWPIDIAIAVIWVVFGVNFLMTLVKRREKHMYVALWFYIATFVTVAILHIFNSIVLPVSFLKSYPVYAGIQDALVQWWYGHNAVAFFLTTPFLGLMYYFIPKAVNRPVYSYRLSIIHFWALIFIYIWAGPHHLLNTALPDWLQTMGVVFSVMLWAPSWGGMINGLLTLRGSWHLLRTDPIVKFFVTAVTFYGMSTFEGPLLSIKSINSLAHYTDWIIGHVHAGALGWNGFMAFGLIYYLIPKLFDTKLYSRTLANAHFWLGTLGIIFYYSSMLAAGLTQGLMWRALDSNGQLVYPDFVETVTKIVPLYYIRIIGGTLYLVGFIIMIYNIIKTVKSSQGKVISVAIPEKAYFPNEKEGDGHRKLEGMAMTFTILATIAVVIGSVIELVPAMSMHKYVSMEKIVEPLTPLELAGRDIYIREGCYVCHSQMIRKMTSDVLRFGEPSTIEQSMYDHPFQWGSKRTGPDLARVGKKYPNMWHYEHMKNPRQVVQNSLMPNYSWLYKKDLDYYSLRKKLSALKRLGVPYTEQQVVNADVYAQSEADGVAESLVEAGVKVDIANKEILALIIYLQSLGQKGGD
ncbi:MAG: cytochrome-c oxidase, cbb3-type subunit I [Bdellovibrionaceae bacterium]|nr:cytochrome-c oxidase, cbb3-type subunit I [Pseudobdellovibrionaceae bacterium]